MNALPRPSSRQIEPIARRLTPVIHDMIAAELRRTRVDRVVEIEEEIMGAAAAVGMALDELLQAKFSPGEPHARTGLEQAAKALRRIMKKHGRMP